MTKEYLLYLTLKHLKESLQQFPERLHVEDVETGYYKYEGPTIIWKFRVEIDGTFVQDPNNPPGTIIVTYNKLSKTMIASIYFREIFGSNSGNIADATVELKYRFWPILYRSYRTFSKLRNILVKENKRKKNMDYTKKLMSIFPSVGDDDLFG